MDDSKTSVPGSAEPQLRNGCLSFWSVKAELGLRGPGRGGTAGGQTLSFHHASWDLLLLGRLLKLVHQLELLLLQRLENDDEHL